MKEKKLLVLLNKEAAETLSVSSSWNPVSFIQLEPCQFHPAGTLSVSSSWNHVSFIQLEPCQFHPAGTMSVSSKLCFPILMIA